MQVRIRLKLASLTNTIHKVRSTEYMPVARKYVLIIPSLVILHLHTPHWL